MKNLGEEELEKFIRDNKEKFDIYEPEPSHNQHFLNKLFTKFKEVIDIVPYLVKAGIATLLIFILSFLIWRAYISPPLTRISFKYWKAERDYKQRINRTTRLTFHSIANSEEKAEFEAELQKYDDDYQILKQQLKEDPSTDNIAKMLKFYQDELLTLQANIQNYSKSTIKAK